MLASRKPANAFRYEEVAASELDVRFAILASPLLQQTTCSRSQLKGTVEGAALASGSKACQANGRPVALKSFDMPG